MTTNTHTYHIPVMGIGYTVDTPLRVAHYGLDSVIPLLDDILLERLRKMYCERYNLAYQEISKREEDYRAKRITAYLNLVNSLIDQRFNAMIDQAEQMPEDLRRCLDLLPEHTAVKQTFYEMTADSPDWPKVKNWLRQTLRKGSVDVNIMTKLDRPNFKGNEALPIEYNDAHAALRGYANSKLSSSMVLSAGMNPHLYSYFEKFEDFYPDEKGTLRKKVTLKVSDYRSALIQGKFMAKKGLWVSEYRIESGLNCGGHAFASNGYLLGPVLEEFKEKRATLLQTVHEIYVDALQAKTRPVPQNPLPMRVVAQGGVGTAEEHRFLLDHYKVDAVGWGTAFLLVPEVANVDEVTLNKLEEAREQDLFLSTGSPLGVPLNTLKGNSKDIERMAFIAQRKPGSTCPKHYGKVNVEFTERPVCVSSRQYQKYKIEWLNKQNLPLDEYQKQYSAIVEKSCICAGLGISALLVNDLDTTVEGDAVSVCPGPNLAYFSKRMSLEEMTDHIYGRKNMISRNDRPQMFVKELMLYIDFLRENLEKITQPVAFKIKKYWQTYVKNLYASIAYYEELFQAKKDFFVDMTNADNKDNNIFEGLKNNKTYLEKLAAQIEELELA